MEVYEGGVRVPAIVRWPGVTRAGTVSDQPVITMDWTATMIAAAGGRPDPRYPLDGEDQRLTLVGRRPVSDRSFYWRTKNQGAVRNGKWKYVRSGANEALFDLSVDEHEQADFSNTQPQTLAEFRDLFRAWESQMVQYPKPAG
jgi:arylsulfatase A-like enzyme